MAKKKVEIPIRPPGRLLKENGTVVNLAELNAWRRKHGMIDYDVEVKNVKKMEVALEQATTVETVVLILFIVCFVSGFIYTAEK